MTIVENTDRRLVIEHKPWLLAGFVWFMGLLALYSGITGADMDGLVERLVVLGLGVGTCVVAWYYFAFVRITFDRDRGEVEHRALRVTGPHCKYLRLDRVLGAQVEAHWDSDGARMTRLALDTEDGRAQLEYGYGPGDRRALEAAVNEWLTRPVYRTAALRDETRSNWVPTHPRPASLGRPDAHRRRNPDGCQPILSTHDPPAPSSSRRRAETPAESPTESPTESPAVPCSLPQRTSSTEQGMKAAT